MSVFRHALRTLAKSPGFTFVAVVALAVGIAATASLFAVVNGLLRDPLPYPQADRLVQVWRKDLHATLEFTPLSVPDYFDVRERTAIFSDVGAFSVQRLNLGGGHPEAIDAAACTPGVFHALGVPPLHGRWFSRDDDAAGAPVVLLSHSFWQRHFASDPAVVGRTLRLDGRDHTIVGVMPADFALLSAWTRERPLALWTLLPLRRDSGSRQNFWLSIIGRLQPGVTSAQARSELEAAARQIAAADPAARPPRTLWQLSLSTQLGGLAALRVSVLLAAGWTLLVLAAQDVAGMRFARGIARQPELAVRMALGARRGHIVRLVLAEGLLLSLFATALAFLLTLWGMDALASLLPAEVLPRHGLHVDASLLLCLAGLAAFCTQVAGLAPALLAAKTDVLTHLKDGSSNATAARRTQRKLRSLVIAQIALALFLVSVALQLSATYRQMLASSQRLLSDRVLTAALAVKGDAYREDSARDAFWQRLLDHAASLPGVRDVAVTTKLPFDGGVAIAVLPDDEPIHPDLARPFVEVSYVSPGFFPAVGATLLHGRLLDRTDAARHRTAVVVNRAFAERHWPGRSPLGRHLREATSPGSWSAEIVGVIDDIRQSVELPARPEMYFPFSDFPQAEAFLVVRTVPGLAAPVEALRDRLRQLDPDLAFGDVKTLEHLIARRGRAIAVITTLVDVFSVGVLALAALGLYGTLSFYFGRRRREIGVRLTLGASPRDILWLAFRQAAAWVAIGLAIGAAGTLLWSFALRAFLSDASPLPLGQLLVCVAVVAATAAFAAWLPARRATRVDPIATLRAE